jgi:dolichol-phosphate mannosyltransferase
MSTDRDQDLTHWATFNRSRKTHIKCPGYEQEGSAVISEGKEFKPTIPSVREDYTDLAGIHVNVPLSIIVPTYKEVLNIPHLLGRIDKLRRTHGLICEVLFMDDDSADGSVEAVENSGYDFARIIVRKQNRGLSPAVIDGLRLARNPVLICMDCDLSHPAEKIPTMVLALASGQQMVLGSRYVPGGSTSDDWGIFRWLNSRVATLLARPLTNVKDPMSGFFALRKSDFEQAHDLNPVGYKVALELIVKCGFENVGEIPIGFIDRVYGESKLTLKEQLKYIKHLRRLYLYRFGEAMHLAQFIVVGATGVVVNLVVLTLCQKLGASPAVAIASGICVSIISNFALNRRFSFSYARDRSWRSQFLGFVIASGVGATVNFSVALYLQSRVLAPTMPHSLQIAALAGIISGMAFNFIANRYFVFRKRFFRT